MLWCSSQTMRTKARHDSCRPYNRPTTGKREFTLLVSAKNHLHSGLCAGRHIVSLRNLLLACTSTRIATLRSRATPCRYSNYACADVANTDVFSYVTPKSGPRGERYCTSMSRAVKAACAAGGLMVGVGATTLAPMIQEKMKPEWTHPLGMHEYYSNSCYNLKHTHVWIYLHIYINVLCIHV